MSVPSDKNGETCPDCKGSGGVAVQVGGGPDAYEQEVQCPRCGGTGALRPPSAPIKADIALDLSLLDTLLVRCGACLQKYSVDPHGDQVHLTGLYECPHCKHPLDSRAWLYAIRNLQKMLATRSASAEPTDRQLSALYAAFLRHVRDKAPAPDQETIYARQWDAWEEVFGKGRRTESAATLADENRRFRNGFANLSQALADAPGLPIECLSPEDQAKWTDTLTGILMALGVLETTGRPLHLFEALTEAVDEARLAEGGTT